MRIDAILDPTTPPDDAKELGLLAEHYGLGAVWNSNYPSSRDPFINLHPEVDTLVPVRQQMLTIFGDVRERALQAAPEGASEQVTAQMDALITMLNEYFDLFGQPDVPAG